MCVVMIVCQYLCKEYSCCAHGEQKEALVSVVFVLPDCMSVLTCMLAVLVNA